MKAFPKKSIVKRIDQTDFESLKANTLDKDQSEAGDQFQELYYKSQLGSGSCSNINERVDGGKGYYEIPNAVIDAQKCLGQAARAVGKVNYAIVHKFVGEELSAKEIAAQFGESGDRAEKYYRRLLGTALMQFAWHWNIKREDRRRSSYFIRDNIVTIMPEMWENEDDS